MEVWQRRGRCDQDGASGQTRRLQARCGKAGGPMMPAGRAAVRDTPHFSQKDALSCANCTRGLYKAVGNDDSRSLRHGYRRDGVLRCEFGACSGSICGARRLFNRLHFSGRLLNVTRRVDYVHGFSGAVPAAMRLLASYHLSSHRR